MTSAQDRKLRGKGQEAYTGPTLLLLLEAAEMIGKAWTSTGRSYLLLHGWAAAGTPTQQTNPL